jgi:hypothetical protein
MNGPRMPPFMDFDPISSCVARDAVGPLAGVTPRKPVFVSFVLCFSVSPCLKFWQVG